MGFNPNSVTKLRPCSAKRLGRTLARHRDRVYDNFSGLIASNSVEVRKAQGKTNTTTCPRCATKVEYEGPGDPYVGIQRALDQPLKYL